MYQAWVVLWEQRSEGQASPAQPHDRRGHLPCVALPHKLTFAHTAPPCNVLLGPASVNRVRDRCAPHQVVTVLVRCHPMFVHTAEALEDLLTRIRRAQAQCSSGAKRARLALLLHITQVSGVQQ